MRPAVKLRLFAAPAADAAPGRELDLLATAVLLIDEHGRITYANPAAENLFELSRVKFLHHSLNELFGRCAPLADAVLRAQTSGASYTEQELELGVTGKPKLHLTCTVSAIDAADAVLLLEF